MTTAKNIVIVGAGPGVGKHVAMKFTSQGFHAILIKYNIAVTFPPAVLAI